VNQAYTDQNRDICCAPDNMVCNRSLNQPTDAAPEEGGDVPQDDEGSDLPEPDAEEAA
jgi:hypothetical protein